MPGGKTQFSKEWLKLQDCNGCLLSTWCEPLESDVYKACCKICNKELSCDNQGAQQILQHAKGALHQQLIKVFVNGSQLTLNVSEGKLKCQSPKDYALKAELIWAMKVVSSNYSYNSCDNIVKTFQAMFPGSVPENITLGPRKVSYIVSEALGPYFHSSMSEDVNSSTSFYTLEYDETTNKQVLKQLDMVIRYWSDKLGCITKHHLRTFLLGHCTGQILSDKILLAIKESNLSLNRLLMLGSDGPNVNKSVWTKINAQVRVTEGRKSGLIDIGSCKLHVVHNCYGKGLQAYGKNVSDLAIDIYTWFKLSAARREDFCSIQVKLGIKIQKFLKHVECRWLSLLAAIVRLLEQWDAILEYFLKYLPKTQPKECETNSRYKRVKNQLQSGETLVQLHFLKSVATLFNNFLCLFQADEPLIHILYDRVFELVVLLLSRFVKKEIIESQRPSDLKNIDYKTRENQLVDSSMCMGEDAKVAMQVLPKEKHPQIMLRVRSFYEAIAKHMLEKLVFSSSLVKDCRCLQPNARVQTWSLEASKSMARKLPVGVDVDVVGDEWRLYQLEQIPQDWYSHKSSEKVTHIRIDHYWKKVFDIKNCKGEPKYPSLTKLVKSALVLAHGNADVERGFSESGKAVTSERTSLSETSINSIRSASDGLKVYGNNPHLVPITKRLLSLGHSAHAHYTQRLEEEKQRKEKEKKELLEKEAEEKQRAQQRDEMEKRNERLLQKEERLSIKESSEKEELNLGSAIVKEANEKLKEALKKKDLNGIALAQAILETGQKKVEEGTKNLEQTREEQKKVEKRKQSLITSFIQPPKKKQK